MRRSLVLTVASLVTALLQAAVSTANADDFAAPSIGEQLRRQWTIEDVVPKPEARSSIVTRDDTVERLSLREAVAAALENNPAIARSEERRVGKECRSRWS